MVNHPYFDNVKVNIYNKHNTTFAKSSKVEKDGDAYGIIHLPKFYVDFNSKESRDCAKDGLARLFSKRYNK